MGYWRTLECLGGGQITPPCYREPLVVESRAGRHSKALHKTRQNHLSELKIEVTHDVKVWSNVKIRSMIHSKLDYASFVYECASESFNLVSGVLTQCTTPPSVWLLVPSALRQKAKRAKRLMCRAQGWMCSCLCETAYVANL